MWPFPRRPPLKGFAEAARGSALESPVRSACPRAWRPRVPALELQAPGRPRSVRQGSKRWLAPPAEEFFGDHALLAGGGSSAACRLRCRNPITPPPRSSGSVGASAPQVLLPGDAAQSPGGRGPCWVPCSVYTRSVPERRALPLALQVPVGSSV